MNLALGCMRINWQASALCHVSQHKNLKSKEVATAEGPKAGRDVGMPSGQGRQGGAWLMGLHAGLCPDTLA